MVLGLKSGTVALADHEPEWGAFAARMIERLKGIFGSAAVEIQHVGSTSIQGIKAKPIIDIAVGVRSFDDLDDIFLHLDEDGIVQSAAQPIPGVILCSFKDKSVNEKYAIHIEVFDDVSWHNHVDFRDYLNAFPQKARAYEDLKVSMAKRYPDNREAYLNGKMAFIEKTIAEAGRYKKTR